MSAALAEQLLALITEQCAVRPTILVIDDLQWADQASVTFWGRLARSVRQVPLLLVGMMRSEPRRDDLLALRRSVGDGMRPSDRSGDGAEVPTAAPSPAPRAAELSAAARIAGPPGRA